MIIERIVLAFLSASTFARVAMIELDLALRAHSTWVSVNHVVFFAGLSFGGLMITRIVWRHG